MTYAKVPVALFVYKRPEHTRTLLESLSQCHGLDRCQVHVYCDGAAEPRHRDAVLATRKTVQAWALGRQAEVVCRDENLGLARSITQRVSELCASYGRVIVVEDDLVPHRNFLDFMIRALDRYADAAEVYQISGFSFPLTPASERQAYFLPMCSTWGWATWSRAWRHFEWQPTDALAALAAPGARNKFDLGGVYPYSAMLTETLRGQVDAWGIRWQYAVFRKQGMVLYPETTLIWNAGFDGSGIHCGAETGAWQPPRAAALAAPFPESVQFPAETVIAGHDVGRLQQFLAAHQLAPRKPLWRRLASRLRNIWRSGRAAAL